jgi:predicted metal-dependent peptidase
MVVNGRKSDPRIGYKAESPTVLPHDKMIFIPDKWPENETADHYYNLLLKEAEKHPIPPGSGEDGHMEIGEFSGDMIDNHQIWMQTEISVDEARQMINERVKNANEKAQGHVPGHLKEALEELKKPIVRWREQLKAFLGTHVGNRRRTYSRPDRRQDAFGTKGISHHAACDVTVIVDTSGSISKDELEQFFGEIECIAYRAMQPWPSMTNGSYARHSVRRS